MSRLSIEVSAVKVYVIGDIMLLSTQRCEDQLFIAFHSLLEIFDGKMLVVGMGH